MRASCRLQNAPGSELVNFARGRVNPRTTFDFSGGANLFKRDRIACAVQFDVLNLFGRLFAYNFGNPFEGLISATADD